MRNALMILKALATLIVLSAAGPAFAGALNSANECAVGMRVATSDGHKGQVTRVDHAWSYCYVRQDDTGKEVGYLYSLLRTDSAAAKNDGSDGSGKLIVGTYMCWVGSEASAAGLKITGSSTYESEGQKGKYRLEASGAIVFESGPFATYHARLLADHRIGMNLSGGTFYNLTCDPPR